MSCLCGQIAWWRLFISFPPLLTFLELWTGSSKSSALSLDLLDFDSSSLSEVEARCTKVTSKNNIVIKWGFMMNRLQLNHMQWRNVIKKKQIKNLWPENDVHKKKNVVVSKAIPMFDIQKYVFCRGGEKRGFVFVCLFVFGIWIYLGRIKLILMFLDQA